MSATDFLDTNVLVYSYDWNNPKKQQIARNLIGRALAGECVTSSQVLGEFCSALIGMSSISVINVDAEIVLRAVEAKQRYGIHFYDGMIVAAAERAGCQRIWSEDLNSGQKYLGIRVENPFAE